MAKVSRVAHARQRYIMVPVIDPATGAPKVIDTGRVTRQTGRPITRRITQPELSQPLDPESCGRCGAVIRPKSAEHPGDPYKYVEIKTGPFSSRRLVRCAACPSWQPWELSNSLSARLMEIEHRFREAVDGAESTEDMESILSDTAGEIEELAGEKEESADSIESGFQHETEQSMKLRDQAEQLREWASEIEGAQVPDLPEPEETDCDACGGTGKVREAENDENEEDIEDCGDCGGDGTVVPDDPSEEQLSEWRTECADLLPDCPL